MESLNRLLFFLFFKRLNVTIFIGSGNVYIEEKILIKNVKKSVKESFLVVFFLILFALILFKNPENFINSAITIFGYCAVVLGVLAVLFSIRSSKEQRIYRHNLKNGSLLISLGIISFFMNDLLKEMVTLLLGVFLLFQNSNRLEVSMLLETNSKKLCISSLILSVLNLVLALILILNPFSFSIPTNQYLSILIIITQILFVIQNFVILFGVSSHEKETD